MRVKLDENLPAELLEDLRAAGHDADHVHTEGLVGAPDRLILERALQEQRVVLTLDRGLADVRHRPSAGFPGVILFRPPSTGRGAVLAFVRRHLAVLTDRAAAGHLLVVTERSIRRR